MRRPLGLVLACSLLVSLASCGGPPSAEVHAPSLKGRTGVTEVEPIEDRRVKAGQTVYVPAYSSVFITDRAHSYNLAVTLSVRNTDRTRPIVVTSVAYRDQDGKLLRDYLKTPIRLAPLAGTEFFVAESDTTGGVSASFLVDWVAEQPVSPPVVEAVMIGTAGTQGVSFLSPGRVVAERGKGEKSSE
jgi:hypothetical protein